MHCRYSTHTRDLQSRAEVESLIGFGAVPEDEDAHRVMIAGALLLADTREETVGLTMAAGDGLATDLTCSTLHLPFNFFSQLAFRLCFRWQGQRRF